MIITRDELQNMLALENPRQAIFSYVANHLLTQNEKSVVMGVGGDPECRYRGPGSLVCAVGCLIPNEDYLERMEGWGATALPKSLWENTATYELFSEYGVMLCDLQNIHDSMMVEDWGWHLCNYAENHGLEISK